MVVMPWRVGVATVEAQTSPWSGTGMLSWGSRRTCWRQRGAPSQPAYQPPGVGTVVPDGSAGISEGS
jgi:hypothetical protein